MFKQLIAQYVLAGYSAVGEEQKLEAEEMAVVAYESFDENVRRLMDIFLQNQVAFQTAAAYMAAYFGINYDCDPDAKFPEWTVPVSDTNIAALDAVVSYFME